LDELVTVVIPAYNEERHIGACLDSVLAQTYRNLQVVVVESCSTDRTVELVERRRAEDPRVELHTNPRRNIPSSLNVALGAARGRWLVRVDAHSAIPPTYVEQAVTRLAEGTWAGVGGRKDAVGRTRAGRAIAVAMASRLGVGGSTYHHGTTVQEVDHLAFGSYPREWVSRIGGWNDELTANEDFEFDHRLREQGGRLLFDPALQILWECRQSVPDLWRQYFRYGKGKADVVWLHPESVNPRHVVPPAFVVYLLATSVASLRRPRRALVALAPYALVVGAESVRCARRLEDPRDGVWLPASFAAMHTGWGLGFWAGALRLARGPRPARSPVSRSSAPRPGTPVPDPAR
jgi:glycosyltransferase involved in cell wall biosynthesis